MLEGKVAVITGAGAGIGRACVKVFLREGAKVLAVDISGAEQDLPDILGQGVIPFHADVSQEGQIEKMFARALEAFGRVDAVLNVAGTLGGRASEITVEEYEAMTRVNLLGVLLCCKHAIRTMLPTGGGAIVNFSSVGSLNCEDRASLTYSAAKAGVNSLTKSFAVHYGAEGIRANVIAPGFTLTEKILAAPEGVLREMSAKPPMKRGSLPEEQAEVAAFLASDRASYVNGAIVPVDGGWTARLP